RLAPRHPDVAQAFSDIALDAGRLSQAEGEAKNVLSIREHDSGASAVLATLALIADTPEEAKTWLKEPLARDPADHRARALLAAAHYLEGDSTGWKRERDRVLAEDAEYFDVYLGLANVLEMSRRNDEAFALYDAVLARDAENAAALIGKGLLAMREGEEVKARDWLERGFKGDPFNMRAYNQLTFLDSLETYATRRSEHFVFRYRAASDSMLIPLLESSLEDIYRELTDRHGWRPTQPTVVEIAPSHDLFSARVAGLSWIEGIPAVCFGDVIAMDSPRTLAGSSNWVEILRHEFGHVLALGMTRKRVPHWFTEGLSVCLERYPRGPIWDQNLAAAYEDGELIGVDSLTIGFTRPKSHMQRLLAYHESYLIVEDLIKRHGWDAVPKILRGIGDGKSFEDALRDATGESYEVFGKQAMTVVRETAARVPVWPNPDRGRVSRLESAATSKPKDRVTLERLALARYQLGMTEEAREVIERLLDVSPDNARAHGLLGLMEKAEKTPDQGREELLLAAKAGTRDIPVLSVLGEQDAALGDTVAALGRYQRVLEIYPEYTPARFARAELLAARGDKDSARQEYRTLLEKDASAGTAALELARLELQRESGKEADQALQYALGVIPADANVLALRGQALVLMKRSPEAFALLDRARRLDMRNVEVMVGMAAYYLEQGDAEESLYFANLALKYQPEHVRAQALRNRAARQ
ncbi:MAG TPA: tetratricopeptide repeat protein, partial [Candidatus Eisenbacteria bacterium]|nr:tetratricopeptide repeat protein [Candidatus Eisenbacteria bacterium]